MAPPLKVAPLPVKIEPPLVAPTVKVAPPVLKTAPPVEVASVVRLL